MDLEESRYGFDSWFDENRERLKVDYDQHIFAMNQEGGMVKSLWEFAKDRYIKLLGLQPSHQFEGQRVEEFLEEVLDDFDGMTNEEYVHLIDQDGQGDSLITFDSLEEMLDDVEDRIDEIRDMPIKVNAIGQSIGSWLKQNNTSLEIGGEFAIKGNEVYLINKDGRHYYTTLESGKDAYLYATTLNKMYFQLSKPAMILSESLDEWDSLMEEREEIEELLDSEPYPVTQGDESYIFDVDGTSVEFRLYPGYPGEYSLEFIFDGSYSKEDDLPRNAWFKFWSTIKNIFQSFIKDKDPERFKFSNWSDTPKLIPLYTKFAETIEKEYPEYEMEATDKTTPSGPVRTFTFTRRPT